MSPPGPSSESGSGLGTRTPPRIGSSHLHNRISYPTLRFCSSPVSPGHSSTSVSWGVRNTSRDSTRQPPASPAQQDIWLESSESLVDPCILPQKRLHKTRARRDTPSLALTVDSMSTFVCNETWFSSLGGQEEDLVFPALSSPSPMYASPTSPSPSYHAQASPTQSTDGYSFSRTEPLQSLGVGTGAPAQPASNGTTRRASIVVKRAMSIFRTSFIENTLASLDDDVARDDNTGPIPRAGSSTRSASPDSYLTELLDDDPCFSPATFFSRSRAATPTPADLIHDSGVEDPFFVPSGTPQLFQPDNWLSQSPELSTNDRVLEVSPVVLSDDDELVSESSCNSDSGSDFDQDETPTRRRVQLLRPARHRSLTPLGIPFPSVRSTAMEISADGEESESSSVNSSFWECRGQGGGGDSDGDRDPGDDEAEGPRENGPVRGSERVKWELVETFPRRSC